MANVKYGRNTEEIGRGHMEIKFKKLALSANLNFVHDAKSGAPDWASHVRATLFESDVWIAWKSSEYIFLPKRGAWLLVSV
jgi:hypothetical protein